jgi:hypothetical protein
MMISADNLSALLTRIDDLADIEGLMAPAPGLVTRTCVDGVPDKDENGVLDIQRLYSVEYIDEAPSSHRANQSDLSAFKLHHALVGDFRVPFNGCQYCARIDEFIPMTTAHDDNRGVSVLVARVRWKVAHCTA